MIKLKRFSTSFKPSLLFSPSVAHAKTTRTPLLALESTIISHGMHYPLNLDCALMLQQIAREEGCQPATIAIDKGKMLIGLDKQTMERLAKLGPQNKIQKISRRNLSFELARGSLGATTVAATMICAKMAEIPVFATGGIGGVHRGGEVSMDISADLRELGRSQVAVVSAGVKSILDIQKTLQYLQTEGVPVITLGSDQFPAFYSKSSGIKSPMSVHSVEEAAAVVRTSMEMRLGNGLLIAVPPQKSLEHVQTAIKQAIQQCNKQNITGHKITPFLLKRVNEITKGQSLKANIQLVKNNVRAGARIARALSRLQRTFSLKRPLVIGGCAVDIVSIMSAPIKQNLYSLGKISSTFGGVGRNIAEAASRISNQIDFITFLGDQPESRQITQHLLGLGVAVMPIRVERTGKFNCIMDHKGQLHVAVSDFQFYANLTLQKLIDQQLRHIEIGAESLVYIDSNFGPRLMGELVEWLASKKAVIFVEGISNKVKHIFESGKESKITCLKMNKHQHKIMAEEFGKDFRKRIAAQREQTRFPNLIVTREGQGVSAYFKDYVFNASLGQLDNIVKVNGAGDTMAGVMLSYLSIGTPAEQSIVNGMFGSIMTLQSKMDRSAISTLISKKSIEESRVQMSGRLQTSREFY